MKKTIIIILISFDILFSSTLQNLKITDNDFMQISNLPQKNSIFERINQLIILKNSLQDVDDNLTKLTSVNTFFNEYRYQSDEIIYNKKDYWASRKEFIIKGAGDCEDFVIAKYFTLLELGIDESKLLILHNLHNNENHLVLGYKENLSSEVLVLDSINKNILPLSKRDDLLILYTLEIIDTENEKIENLHDLRVLSNYKWSSIYKKSVQ